MALDCLCRTPSLFYFQGTTRFEAYNLCRILSRASVSTVACCYRSLKRRCMPYTSIRSCSIPCSHAWLTPLQRPTLSIPVDFSRRDFTLSSFSGVLVGSSGMSVDAFDTGFDHNIGVLCDGGPSGSSNSITGVLSQEPCIACREEEEKSRRLDIHYRRYPDCNCFFRRSTEESAVGCRPLPPPPHLCIAPGSFASSRSGHWCRRPPDDSSSDFETVQAPPPTICAAEELQWWANRKDALAAAEVVGVRVDRTARGAPPSQPIRPWHILGCCGVRLCSLERCRPESHPTVPSLPLQPPPSMVTKKMALKSWKDGQRALRGQVLVGRKALAIVIGGCFGLFALTAGLMVGIVLASSKMSSSRTTTQHLDSKHSLLSFITIKVRWV